jgi:ABC-type transport system substrate-binding protein
VYNWFVPPQEIERLRLRHPADYSCRPRFATAFLFFDMRRPPFDDARVRRAFAMAIDRAATAGLVYRGYELPADGGFVPPGMPGHLPGIGLPFDPPGARRLLADAGYPHGRGLPPQALSVYHTRQSTATDLQAQWRANLGIEVGLHLLGPETTAEQLLQRHAPISFGGWIADYADPDNFLRVCVALDVPEWRNDAYERLLERARLSAHQAERVRLYQQADHILTEQAVFVPISYSQHHLMLKPWVRQFPIPAIKNPGFWKDVIIEPHT